MSVEDDLRLAWQDQRDGRAVRRDALLTLAAAEAAAAHSRSTTTTADLAWVARCRKRLVAARPDHLFAPFPTVSQAIRHPRVAAALGRLRASLPPSKVRWLGLRDAARRGPWTGRAPSLSLLLDDLLGRSTPHSQGVGAAPGPSSPVSLESAAGSLPIFYLRVLMAIAVLMEMLQPSADEESRAA